MFIKTTQFINVAKRYIIHTLIVFGPPKKISYENSETAIKYEFIAESTNSVNPKLGI
jgi:hypothetical protein